MENRDAAAVQELKRMVERRELGNLPKEIVQNFFRRFEKRLFVAVCVELLDYRTLGMVEQLSVEFKALIIQRNIWERKFKHDFPALANVEMTPFLKRYLDDRSLQLEDPAGSRDWMNPSRKLTQSRGRDYTLWKRYYELLVKLPTNMQQIGQPLQGHTESVVTVAFSPDGTLLASSDETLYDNTIRLWDVETGQQIGQPLQGHTDLVLSVAFSPDGTTLASGSVDGTIRMWDVESHEQIGEPISGHDDVIRSIAFSPDGTMLAGGSYDGPIILWDVETYNQIHDSLLGHDDIVKSVTFSPDGTMLASGSIDETIRLWDVDAQEQIGQPLIGHTDWVYSIAFSPDGTVLASGSRDDTIRLWNVETHEQIGEPLFGNIGSVSSVAFLPDGTTLVGASWDGAIRLWNVETREQIGEPLRGPKPYASVVSMALSPNGTMLASGYGAPDDCSIILWGIPPDQKTLVSSQCSQCQMEPARYAHKNDSRLMFCGVECALQFNGKQ